MRERERERELPLPTTLTKERERERERERIHMPLQVQVSERPGQGAGVSLQCSLASRFSSNVAMAITGSPYDIIATRAPGRPCHFFRIQDMLCDGVAARSSCCQIYDSMTQVSLKRHVPRPCDLPQMFRFFLSWSKATGLLACKGMVSSMDDPVDEAGAAGAAEES